MDFLFPFVFFGVVVFLVFRYQRKRQQFFEGLKAEIGFAADANPGMGVVEMSGKVKDRIFHLEFAPKTRSHPATMNVTMDIDQPYSFRLKRQTAFTGFSTRLGVGQDLVVGDAEFDDAFEIHAEDTEEIRRLFSHPRFRDLAMTLGSPTLIHIVGERNRVVFREQFTQSEAFGAYVHQLLGLLADFGAVLESRGDEREQAGDEDAEDRAEASAGVGAADRAAEPPAAGTVPSVDDSPMGEDAKPEFEAAASKARNDGFGEAKAIPDVADASGTVETPDTEETPATADTSRPADTADPVDLVRRVDSNELEPVRCAELIGASGEDGVRRAVGLLGDYRLRDAAGRVLVLVDPGLAVPAMVAALSEFSLSYEIRRLVGSLPESAFPILLGEVDRDHDAEIKKALFEMIGELKPPGAQEKLEPYVTSEDYTVRYAAESALRRLGLGYDEIDRLKRGAE